MYIITDLLLTDNSSFIISFSFHVCSSKRFLFFFFLLIKLRGGKLEFKRFCILFNQRNKKNTIILNYIPIAGAKILGFIPFVRALAIYGMPTAVIRDMSLRSRIHFQ